MKEERIKRFTEKLDFLNDTLENLEKWIKDIEVKIFVNDLELQKKYAIYYAFQISVELFTDIVAMIVKDLKKIPMDDYTNIDILKNKEIITPDLAAHLREANGLRNRIVHDYNGMDESIAFNSLLKLLKHLKEFYEVIRNWLKKNS